MPYFSFEEVKDDKLGNLHTEVIPIVHECIAQ